MPRKIASSVEILAERADRASGDGNGPINFIKRNVKRSDVGADDDVLYYTLTQRHDTDFIRAV